MYSSPAEPAISGASVLRNFSTLGTQSPSSTIALKGIGKRSILVPSSSLEIYAIRDRSFPRSAQRLRKPLCISQPTRWWASPWKIHTSTFITTFTAVFTFCVRRVWEGGKNFFFFLHLPPLGVPVAGPLTGGSPPNPPNPTGGPK